MNRFSRVAALVVAGCLCSACDESLVVRWSTRVFEDGSVERRIDLSARDADGNVPADPGWIERETKVQIADPETWDRIERDSGHLSANGFFQNARFVPRTIAHKVESGSKADRVALTIESQNYGVFDSWTSRESYGDPYSKGDAESSLRSILDMIRRVLLEGVRRDLGEPVDPKPVDAFLAKDLGPLLTDLVDAGILSPEFDETNATAPAWMEVLARRRIDVPASSRDVGSQAALDPIMSWCRHRLAGKLSSRRRIVQPADLEFLTSAPSRDPDASTSGAGWTPIVESLWGSEERFGELVASRLEAIQRVYGSGFIPGFSFESRLSHPGRLVRTNGTSDGDGVTWFFRGKDVAAEDQIMEAEWGGPERRGASGSRRATRVRYGGPSPRRRYSREPRSTGSLAGAREALGDSGRARALARRPGVGGRWQTSPGESQAHAERTREIAGSRRGGRLTGVSSSRRGRARARRSQSSRDTAGRRRTS